MAELSKESALYQRVLAWMDERFPFKNALLFFILYLTVVSVARFSTDQSILFSWTDIIGCIVIWGLFLLIRIFDEHKDYAIDVINHPQRVLQSGLITLKHLKILGAVSIVVQLLWSYLMDNGSGAVLIAWLIMFAYLCLMGVEFFCGKWLEQRLVLYALSHMLIMLLIVWWIAQLAVPEMSLNTAVMVLMGLVFVSGFCFEITRKTRGHDEERETLDSYSKIMGTNNAAYFVLFLVSLMTVAQICLLLVLGIQYWYVYAVILIAMLLLAFKSVFGFIKQPTLAHRENNENAVALVMLMGYLVIIISVLIAHFF